MSTQRHALQRRLKDDSTAVDAIANRDDPTLLNVITPIVDDKSDIVRYDASATLLRLSGGKTAE
jgi:hypothetical protein